MIAATFHATAERQGIVLEPDGSPLEAAGILNPAVTRDRNGMLRLYPRMVEAGNISRIGLVRATHADGTTTFVREGFALEPAAPYELREYPGWGCEDPRITFIPRLDRYVMCYTAYGPAGPRIALAVSTDALTWERLGRVVFGDPSLDDVGNKDAAFFPEPVRTPSGVEAFAMYHRPMNPNAVDGQTPIPTILALDPAEREHICLAYMPLADVLRDRSALTVATEATRVMPVDSTWGQLKNGAGTPPVAIDEGWLSVYHGVDLMQRDGATSTSYAAGIVIHDRDEPHRVLYRSPTPILAPETNAERFGTIDNVVFPTGIDQRPDGAYDIYYGAADIRIGCAILTLER